MLIFQIYSPVFLTDVCFLSNFSHPHSVICEIVIILAISIPINKLDSYFKWLKINFLSFKMIFIPSFNFHWLPSIEHLLISWQKKSQSKLIWMWIFITLISYQSSTLKESGPWLYCDASFSIQSARATCMHPAMKTPSSKMIQQFVARSTTVSGKCNLYPDVKISVRDILGAIGYSVIVSAILKLPEID